jgi:hypothetical protein
VPTTLLLNIIYQQLWEKGIDWDENAPQEIGTNWKMGMKGLIGFEQLNIPHWIAFANNVISAKIPVFGDALEATYKFVGSKRKTKILTSSCQPAKRKWHLYQRRR